MAQGSNRTPSSARLAASPTPWFRLAVARAPPPAPSPARASFVSAAMPPSEGKNRHPSASHPSLSLLPRFRKHRRREKRRPPILCRCRRRSGVPGARATRRRWMLCWRRRRSGPQGREPRRPLGEALALRGRYGQRRDAARVPRLRKLLPAPLLVPRPCSFDLGLPVSANC